MDLRSRGLGIRLTLPSMAFVFLARHGQRLHNLRGSTSAGTMRECLDSGLKGVEGGLLGRVSKGLMSVL